MLSITNHSGNRYLTIVGYSGGCIFITGKGSEGLRYPGEGGVGRVSLASGALARSRVGAGGSLGGTVTICGSAMGSGRRPWVSGRSVVRLRNAIIRTVPGTVFGMRVRNKRRVLTRVSNGLHVGFVHVLPNSGMAIRVSPCSLAGKHVA